MPTLPSVPGGLLTSPKERSTQPNVRPQLSDVSPSRFEAAPKKRQRDLEWHLSAQIKARRAPNPSEKTRLTSPHPETRDPAADRARVPACARLSPLD